MSEHIKCTHSHRLVLSSLHAFSFKIKNIHQLSEWWRRVENARHQGYSNPGLFPTFYLLLVPHRSQISPTSSPQVQAQSVLDWFVTCRQRSDNAVWLLLFYLFGIFSIAHTVNAVLIPIIGFTIAYTNAFDAFVKLFCHVWVCCGPSPFPLLLTLIFFANTAEREGATSFAVPHKKTNTFTEQTPRRNNRPQRTRYIFHSRFSRHKFKCEFDSSWTTIQSHTGR